MDISGGVVREAQRGDLRWRNVFSRQKVNRWNGTLPSLLSSRSASRRKASLGFGFDNVIESDFEVMQRDYAAL